MLEFAGADSETVIRYRGKIRTVNGSTCAWWGHAISGRGHGRFWLGSMAGRNVTMIAHRFGWALEMGVESLAQVPVLKPACDNPLCQRIGAGHVQASSYQKNRADWAAHRHTVGSALRDERGARGRSRALRDLLRAEPVGDPQAFATVADAGLWFDVAQIPLWPSDPVESAGSIRASRPEPERVSAAG
jgi:hypothetical protein